MDKVYIIHKTSYEAQCESHDDIEILSTMEKAQIRLAELRDGFMEDVITKFTNTSFSGGCGDWSYYYYIEEYNVK